MSVLKGRLKGASKGGPNPKKELLASIAQQCTAMSLIPRTADSVLKKIENWELTTGKKRREEVCAFKFTTSNQSTTQVNHLFQRIEANKMGGGMNKLHNRSQSPTTIQLDHIAH